MKEREREGMTRSGVGRWRRLRGYALGMVIESAAVGAIALAALGLMFLVKILVK